jgi:hypothetical protein
MTVTTGEHVALALAACMAGAAVLRAALLPLDSWLVGLRLPGHVRSPALAGAAVGGLTFVLVIGIAANVPQVVTAKYQEFTDRENTSPERGEARLLSARPEGRFALWKIAVNAYREDRLRGSGAGTYALRWDRERERGGHVLNAHSLYVETLGELGLVGLVLLAVTLALILGAFAFRARGPDRALFAALLACGFAGALHAGDDWDWEMPATTLWLFAFGGAALSRPRRRRRRRPWSEVRHRVIRVLGTAACIGLAILPARLALSQARLDAAVAMLQRGDCADAREEARAALAAIEARPVAHAVIAYCDMEAGRYRAAAGALEHARRLDPLNWETHYSLAIARAGAGLDPAAAARRAAQLNPAEPRALRAQAALAGAGRGSWEKTGHSAPLLVPFPGDI